MYWGRTILLFLTIVTVLYGTADVFPSARYSDTLRSLSARQGVASTWEPARHTYAGRGQEQGSSYTATKGLYAADSD